MLRRRRLLLALRLFCVIWLIAGGVGYFVVKSREVWAFWWTGAGMFTCGLFMLISGQDMWDIASNPYRLKAVAFHLSGCLARLNGLVWLIPLAVFACRLLATGEQPSFELFMIACGGAIAFRILVAVIGGTATRT
jgi:hypothetical protein